MALKTGKFHGFKYESILYKNSSNGLQIDFAILRTYSYKMRLFPVEKEGSNN